MAEALMDTDLGFPKTGGPVSDIYDLGDSMLWVAKDGITFSDIPMKNGIPGKGKILTQMSLIWRKLTKDIVGCDLISAKTEVIAKKVQKNIEHLNGRTMWVRKGEILPIRCIVRGYLTGSAWDSYSRSGSVMGMRLPKGLKESDKLPWSIFTPITDNEKLIYPEMVNRLTDYFAKRHSQGSEEIQRHAKAIAQMIREKSIALYELGAAFALQKGVILADTTFTFGDVINSPFDLIGDVMTPETSRFWSAGYLQTRRSPGLHGEEAHL